MVIGRGVVGVWKLEGEGVRRGMVRVKEGGLNIGVKGGLKCWMLFRDEI